MKAMLAELFSVPFYYPECQKSLSAVSASFLVFFCFFLDCLLKLKCSFSAGEIRIRVCLWAAMGASGVLEN